MTRIRVVGKNEVEYTNSAGAPHTNNGNNVF